MRTISKNKAMQICSEWHGGQWSKLYSYASSGEYVESYTLHYLQEIAQNLLSGEYALYPYTLPKYQIKELSQLKRYFTNLANKLGHSIYYVKHSIYGYNVPCSETIYLKPILPN